MAYRRSPRRPEATTRVFSFLNVSQSTKRQLFALITAAFILFQPVLLVAQRTRVTKEKNPIAVKPQKSPSDTPSPKAAFSSGNLVIYRVGTGGGALASSATAVFLDEYSTSGGSAVQSIAMPTTDSGPNQTLTASGTATSEGMLTRSTDGNYLVVSGYDAAVGTASITSSASGTISRVIGRVNAAGTVDTTTALTDAISGGNPRSAASTNGTDLWISGTSSGGGIRYATLGATTSTQISSTPTNLRHLNIFGGQLYVSSQTGAFRLSTIGTGTPTTTGQTITNLPGYPTATTSPYGHLFADLDAGVAGVDTVYVADDNATGTGGIQKYSLVGGNWTANGSIANTTGLRGLTGVVSGSNVTLFITSPTSLLTVTDTTGYNNTLSGTLTSIATAPANTAFRGVAFAPGDAAPSVSSTSPVDNATGVALNSNVSITFSEPILAVADAFDINCTTSGNVPFLTSSSDQVTFTLDPQINFANSEVCTVTVEADNVTDQDGSDPPDNMAADYVFDFTTVAATPTLNISDVTQNETNAGTTTFTFNVTLTVPAGGGGVTFDIATADGTAEDDNPATEDNDYVAQSLTGQTISSGTGPYQFNVAVNGDATTETNETFFVNVTNIVGATPGDPQGQGTITNDDIATTPIHDIQGNGATSPLNGSVGVVTTGIVTLLRTGSNAGNGTANGFFLQDPNADADPNTSEGIFVFTSTVPTYTAGGAVAVGDELFVTGTVTEFTSGTGTITEITSVSNITVIDTGNPLPAAVTLDAIILDPAAQPTQPQLEKYEAMRMTGASLISVAPNDNFFDVYTVLSSVPRSMREPGIPFSDPIPPDPTSGTPDANIPIWDENPERIKLDFNGRAGAPNNFYTSNVTFTNITGPLDFAFSEYRIIPDAAPTASANMSAVAVPVPTASEFTVAGFNIENFDNDTTQRQKAALGIRDIMRLPDIIGVIEILNLASLQALRDEVNTISPGAAYEAYLIPTPVSGITQNVGYLVNTARVSVDAGSPTQERTSDTYIDPATGNPDDTHDRPPLVLRAHVDPTGANLPVIVVVNHPRSFIDAGLVGSPGPTVRAKRKAQAESLAGLFQELQTNNPTTSVIAVGDYNSYQFNSGYDDSIAVMKGSPTADDQIVVDASADVVNPNFSNLIDSVPADQRYTFIFEGTPQALDHVLVNTVGLSRNTRIEIAHMNADFPDSPASAFETNAAIPERNSDHDAPVAYFSLTAQQAAGSILISEFRFRGPGGSEDEFVELYNNTDSDITVSTTDGSAGWTVVSSTGAELCTLPSATTTIPARGHYLCTNVVGYSLSDYGGIGAASGDTGWLGTDIPDGGGVALFRTNNPANYTISERLDAAGYSGVNAQYREGAGFPAPIDEDNTVSPIQYAFVRSMTRATGGLPKDTGDNAADFIGVSTNGSPTAQGQYLGAPGPENLFSPINRNSQFTVGLLDPSAPSTAPPNRVRDMNPVTNGTFGTMTVRRTYTNNTGAPVTRLRFRIVEVTTLPVPPGSGLADLRALNSSTEVIVVGVTPTTVSGTTVEEPPTQLMGGGWNTSLNVPDVDGGSIILNAPVNNGQSISVQFRLGVETPGRYLFFLNIEAENGCVSLPAALPCIPAAKPILKPLIRK